MNIQKFTQKSIEAINALEKLAYEYGNQEIEQEHLFVALLTQEDGLIGKLIEKMEIDKEHFAVVETEQNRCTFVIEEIWKLTDEEMKENNLYCRYRYKEKIVKHPEGYKGWMEHESGFNI